MACKRFLRTSGHAVAPKLQLNYHVPLTPTCPRMMTTGPLASVALRRSILVHLQLRGQGDSKRLAGLTMNGETRSKFYKLVSKALETTIISLLLKVIVSNLVLLHSSTCAK